MRRNAPKAQELPVRPDDSRFVITLTENDDLPCPWCSASTSASDPKCPSCSRRFG